MIAVRSDSHEEQPPAQPVIPRLAAAVTFVPDLAVAGATIGVPAPVPAVNGVHLGPPCPECDGPDGAA